MTVETFYLKLSGNTVAGVDRETAAAGLARLLRMSPAQARKLLQGGPSRIRRELTLERAERLRDKLLATGVECMIRLVHRRRKPAQDGASATSAGQAEMEWDPNEEIEVVLEGIGPPLDMEIDEEPQAETIQTDPQAAAASAAGKRRLPRLASLDRRVLLLTGLLLLVAAGWAVMQFFTSPDVVRPAPPVQTQVQPPVDPALATTRSRMTRLGRSIRVWMIQFGAGYDPAQVTLERVRLDLELKPEEMRDGWGMALRYQPEAKGFVLHSAGPDGDFGSSDDLKRVFDLD